MTDMDALAGRLKGTTGYVLNRSIPAVMNAAEETTQLSCWGPDDWKERLGGDFPFVVSMANDELGYVMTAEQFEDDTYSYEQSMSMGPETGPILDASRTAPCRTRSHRAASSFWQCQCNHTLKSSMLTPYLCLTFLPCMLLHGRQCRSRSFLLHIERSNRERYYDPLFIKPLFQHFYKRTFYKETIKILSSSQHYG